MTRDLHKMIVDIEKDSESFGFKWEHLGQIIEQIKSECDEVAQNLDQKGSLEHLQEEVGDLMHATFSLCVFLHFDPHQTLAKSVKKLVKRLNEVKRLAKEKGCESLDSHSFDARMALWNEAKKTVG
jgi:uncharacterized protein YabN with tetrapyrrole methylase and pyrophosphatase domain